MKHGSGDDLRQKLVRRGLSSQTAKCPLLCASARQRSAAQRTRREQARAIVRDRQTCVNMAMAMAMAMAIGEFGHGTPASPRNPVTRQLSHITGT
ncbi:uncharacterized protein MYCFIDRAFT_175653 [Pseudocercospora fijiensis CIRAD86]|uniref:Uncharacterized protein n=1 Tax=Pseudocercospora fijiensis (strain CIRAD86) TaxID=383855 RepID=M2ZSW5_PSEFD|nr:uncharacterized protein MYCFIDRAFT_175653 [Pseudocercospora fijiensis CIRAD86]EME82104.1 hypothetical protein MYCFIDRAFT_175653 [Pseudocercospora fijiensis CIRAD86]